ncbi:hypothetical protein ACFSGX_15315 [Sphingomonas arantia]|uniref:Uncharacterized protein n=1 Tax=Sphingomonas arantia TaxID=1460676 RepID=A0ABW4TZM6_9SPHN
MMARSAHNRPGITARTPRRSGRIVTRLTVAALGLIAVLTGIGVNALLEDILISGIAAGMVVLVLISVMDTLGLRLLVDGGPTTHRPRRRSANGLERSGPETAKGDEP